ncbi:MAG: hypothetical protein ACKOED_08755 [Aestuariivirga sp.]|uniref:hypothetical protein n=1 Tax=Aestuariivirga sp. TaxID=2650926 RepID=UPI0038D0B5A7
MNQVSGDIVLFKNPDPLLRGQPVVSLVSNNIAAGPIIVDVNLTKANPQDGFYSLKVNEPTADSGTIGIKAYSSVGDAVTVISRANIQAPSLAIDARTMGDGDVLVNSTGDLDNTTANPIGSMYQGTITARSTTGAVSVTNNGMITSNYIGIYATSEGSKLVSINNTGDLTVFNRGIDARNYGTGNVEITSTGNIRTTNTTPDAFQLPGLIGKLWRSHGITAVSVSGTINVTASGTIYSTVWDGIYAVNDSGAVTITNNANVTKASSAILVRTNATKQSVTGATTVTNNGTITNSFFGINIVNKGSGAVTVTNNATISTTGWGIFAQSLGGPVTVTVNSGGTITAFNPLGNTADGVFASAAGDVRVDVFSNISAANGAGINAQTSGSSQADVTVIGNITAGSHAVSATGGSGNVTVSATGVMNGGFAGINAAGNGAVSVTSAGSVTGDQLGIFARGGSSVSVVNTANIAATTTIGFFYGGHGIRAEATSGFITINSQGSISSAIGYGIYAKSNGNGVQITNTGLISGGGGISAIAGGTGAINILQTGIISGDAGISAYGRDGKVDVSSVGDITAQTGAGVAVRNKASDGGQAGDVEVSSGSNVTAKLAAIAASSEKSDNSTGKSGKVTVNLTGNIESTSQDAINAKGGLKGVSVTTAGVIKGFADGIDVLALYGGKAMISATGGSVTASKYDGIRGVGGEVSITSAANVTTNGAYQSLRAAIFASSDLAGGLVVVNSSGNVTATNNRGIFARSRDTGAGGVVSVVSNGVVQASRQGIFAYTSSSSGTVSVSTMTGSVTSMNSSAIRAYSKGATSGTGNVTVTNRVNLVAGIGSDTSAAVIDASSTTGSGEVKVDSIGNITGGSGTVNSSARGIQITSGGLATLTSVGTISSDGTSVAIDGGSNVSATLTGSVTALREIAISVISQNGSALVTGSATVTSTLSNGVYVRASGAATFNMTGDVTAANDGVEVRSGSGTATVTPGGTITASGVSSNKGIAIRARSSGSGTVSVTSANTLNAKLFGIITDAQNGTTDISVTGQIRGQTGGSSLVSYGIQANVTGSGVVNLTTSSDISATNRPIYASISSGAANITTNGKVTSVFDTSGTTDHAIGVRSSNGGSITITASGDVTSADGMGIYAKVKQGSGAVTITANAQVTGTTRGVYGYVRNGNLAVTTHQAVTATAATSQGIYGYAEGTGNVTITALGAINANSIGIRAVSNTGNIIVSTNGGFKGALGGTTKVSQGIFARSWSGGTVTVNVSGSLDTVQEAVFARGWSATGTVSVDMQGDAVSASNSAIVVEGNANLSVKVAGLTTGASKFAGVEFGDGGTTNVGGVNNTLQIMGTAHVRNAGNTATVLNQLAIWGRQGNDAVTNFGLVTGSVNLGTGTDSFLNETSGTFLTGDTVNLGAGEVLTNKGNLNVGGTSHLFTTNLTGDVNQSSGVFLVDFKPDDAASNRASDVLVLSGSANLSGMVRASQWTATQVNVEQDFVILQSTGGTVTIGSLGLQLDNSNVAPNITASLVVVDTNKLVLRFTMNSPPPPPPVGRYWDGGVGTTPNIGTVDGGQGVWNSSNLNWTVENGSSNNAWPQSMTAIFAGELGGGAVTVEGTQLFGGLDFRKDGYVLGGDGTLMMLPESSTPTSTSMSVDGGMTATINTFITDGANSYGIVKNGAGQLILTGNNDFNGGVLLNLGTLGVGSNNALGTGALTMENSTTLLAAADNLTVGNLIDVNDAAFLNTQTFTMTLTGLLGDGAGTLNKTGAGKLTLDTTTSLAGLDVQGGTLENKGSAWVSSAMAMSGANTKFLNAAGAWLAVNSGAGSLTGAAGAQSIDNAGIMNTSVNLGADGDSYILRASGSQWGAVAGETGADFLQIETDSGAQRNIAAAAFTGFETIELNLESGSTGKFLLGAASNPAVESTLDTGGGTGSSLTLNRGELSLLADNSSVRALEVNISHDALLSGIGKIFNGPDGLTANAGTISPGDFSIFNDVSGSASIGEINLEGNLSQAANGTFHVDFKPSASPGNRANDALVLTGNAVLSGTVVAQQWSGTVVNAVQSFVILESTDGIVTNNGLTLELVDSAIAPGFTYALNVVDTDKLVLSFTMSEEPSKEVKRTDPPIALVKGTANSVQSFTEDLIGCPQREGVYAYIEEDQCVWANIGSGLSGWNPSGKKGDVDQTTWWLAGGGQAAVTENIRLGMAGRYENISQNVGGNAHTDGVIGHWGAMAAYNGGPLVLASGLSVGKGWMDTRREISVGGFQAKSEADTSVSYVSGKIRGGYLFDFDAWYLKPLVDLDATRLWYGGGTESMDNGMSMSIGSDTENLFSVSPRMEVGGQWETEEGMIFRPMLQLGATIYSDSQFSLSSQFVDTPEDAEVVITKTERDQVTFDVSAAVDVFNAEGNSLRIYYDGSFGETSYSHAGGLRLRIGF